MLAILGLFLRAAAGAERRRAEGLDKVSSGGVETRMLPIVPPITGGLTVAGLESMSSGYETPVAFPLWGHEGVVGLIPSTAVAQTPPADRTLVRVDDLVVDWSEFSSALVDETMPAVIERAREMNKRHVLVYNRAGEQVGYQDLAGVLSLQPA